jgi:hypothetical protein
MQKSFIKKQIKHGLISKAGGMMMTHVAGILLMEEKSFYG